MANIYLYASKLKSYHIRGILKSQIPGTFAQIVALGIRALFVGLLHHTKIKLMSHKNNDFVSPMEG